MKRFIKDNYQYIILFLLLIVLTYFFPQVSDDMMWANKKGFSSVHNFWNLAYGKVLTALFSYVLSKVKIVRIIFYAVTTLSLTIFMKNIVNKKNKTLSFIALFMLLLLDNNILAQTFVSTYGYIYNTIGILFLLIIVSLITNKEINSLNKGLVLLLGVIASSISPIFTIVIIVFSLICLVYHLIKKDSSMNYLALFLGSVIGSAISILSVSNAKEVIYIPNVALNAIEVVIPSIFENNFIIFFVMIILLFFLGVKVFLKGNWNEKILSIISILCIAFFAFVFLLSKNLYLMYISYILNLVSSIYILIHANRSMVFKRKVTLIYLIKSIYLISLILISDIQPYHMLLLYLLDVLIILEIVNYLLPNNFLIIPWFILTVVLMFVHIYVYGNVYKGYNEMTNYINHHLECGFTDIELPSKYVNDYLYDYIPYSKEYLKYYGLDEDISYEITIINS